MGLTRISNNVIQMPLSIAQSTSSKQELVIALKQRRVAR